MYTSARDGLQREVLCVSSPPPRDDARIVVEALLARGFATELFGDLGQGKPGGRDELVTTCPGCGKPKFYYSIQRPVWHCFVGGCTYHEGGDWFDYLKLARGWDFRTALEWLADRAGIKLGNEADQRKYDEYKRRATLLEAGHAWMVEMLWSDTPAAREVLTYLRQERGYSDDDIRGMELGYYAGRTRLEEHLMAKGYGRNGIDSLRRKMEDAGLIGPGFGSTHTAALAVKDAAHRPMRLCCRSILPPAELDGKGLPKYFYSKGISGKDGLPGLSRVRGKKRVLAIEAMFGAELLCFRGIPTVAAGCTTFADEHLEDLKRGGCTALIVALDNSPTGQNGATNLPRLIEQCRRIGLELYVLVYPEGAPKAPDDWVIAAGSTQPLLDAMEAAIPWSEWLGPHLASLYNTGHALGRDECLRRIGEELVRIDDEIHAGAFIKSAARALDLTPSEVSTRLELLMEGSTANPAAAAVTTRGKKKPGQGNPTQEALDGMEAATDPQDKFRASPKERAILRLTDDDNGLRFAEQHCGRLRFCDARGGLSDGWLFYNGRFWEPDENRVRDDCARRTAHAIVSYGMLRAQDLPPEDIEFLALKKINSFRAQKARLAFGVQTKSDKALAAMLRRAASAPGMAVRPRELDQQQHLLNCLNGTLDVVTGELRPHKPTDMITKLAPVEYDPHAACKEWQTFLLACMGAPRPEEFEQYEQPGELQDEATYAAIMDLHQRAHDAQLAVEFLQRLMGLLLTGDMRFQYWYFLHGEGGNGKGTFLRILLRLLGPYARPMTTEFIGERPRGGSSGNNQIYELAGLEGARLAVHSDLPVGTRFNMDMIKQITGGDRMVARQPYGKPYDFAPQCKLLIACNDRPPIYSTDYGTWRRIVFIPFEVRFEGAADDKFLYERLEGELPGILNFAVEGYRQLRERALSDDVETRADPLCPPPHFREAVRVYADEMDLARQFISEECTVYPGHDCPKAELYQAFREWLKEGGYPDQTIHRFGKQVKRLMHSFGFGEHRGTGGKQFWRGIMPPAPTGSPRQTSFYAHGP